jgi:flagellar hook protein FlgE
MEIQSAFNSGVQGFQKATESANQAASDIANQTTSARRAEEQFKSETVAPTETKVAIAPEQPVELTEAVVNLKVAEFQSKASAEVIKTADEALGSLIDVRA